MQRLDLSTIEGEKISAALVEAMKQLDVASKPGSLVFSVLAANKTRMVEVPIG